MGKHWKILGMSLLALIGVMAVSASAAQAKFSLKKNGANVDELKLVGSFALGKLVAPGLNVTIHCEVTNGKVTAKLNLSTGAVSVSGSGKSVKCKVEGAGVCTVRSPTTEKGEIAIAGEGAVEMVGATTFAKLESEEFTTVIFEGEECSLNEVELPVHGSATIAFGNAETEEKVHTGALDDDKLFMGEEEVTLEGGTGIDTISGSAEEEKGEKYSIVLS